MFIPFIFSFAATAIALPFFINFMKRKQFGQMTREEGPAWHQVKSGTPTMGGTVFLVTIFLTLILFVLFSNDSPWQVLILMFTLVFFGLIGFTDDFLKIFKKQNEGLKSGQKFTLQIVGATVLAVLMTVFDLDIVIPLPVIGNISSPIFIAVFLLIWITGFSNAYNLTDGLDGLAGGLGIISFSAYAWLASAQDEKGIAAFCLVVVAGLLAFLLFNVKPAKIFMGDVGSLALGAVLAVISIMLNNPWTLLLLGLIYWVETASVIIQVASFKMTGRRVFKMSPLHHHFEMSGWSEWKVVLVFWAVGLVAATIGLLVI